MSCGEFAFSVTIAAGQLQPQRQIRRDLGWRAGAWALFDRGYSSLPALLAVRQFAAPGVGIFSNPSAHYDRMSAGRWRQTCEIESAIGYELPK